MMTYFFRDQWINAINYVSRKLMDEERSSAAAASSSAMDEDMEPMQENGGSEYVLVPNFPGGGMEGGMASGPISAISGLPTSAYTVTKRKRKIVSFLVLIALRSY